VYFDNDRRIASAGLDNMLRIWDVKSERCLATVTSLVGPINTVAWKVVATNGAVYFATGSEDKSVRQWKMVLDDRGIDRAKLDWTSNCERLVVLETNVHGSKDLSTGNLQLLKQRELSVRRAGGQ
jgi:WD40 repeat protein